ncbi:DUF3164 family protein [Bacteroides neonati]|uniref:DUF3164 family protein n=1 Tax=Bacteroides neonati TaxID=1347393 RepID=UPI0004B6222B|nr:DUF3164 family protein [Bacteroides neonati]
MDVSNLTKAQRLELKAQLEAEERAEEANLQRERQSYNAMRDEFVTRTFQSLKQLSGCMQEQKQTIFEESAELDTMQQRLFKVKMDRKSRTLTHSDGRISIKVGNRLNDGWDDSVEIGIEKVREYLATLATDEKSARLVNAITSLLAKDQKGTLKANKVLELEKMANESKDDTFLEGLRIIKEAYRPVPTCQFVEVKYKDENDVERSLPLSMSAMDI